MFDSYLECNRDTYAGRQHCSKLLPKIYFYNNETLALCTYKLPEQKHDLLNLTEHLLILYDIGHRFLLYHLRYLQTVHKHHEH